MSLYPIGLFGWRELKADAELRVYNYYKPQSPLFVMAAPMGSHPEFEPGRQRDEMATAVLVAPTEQLRFNFEAARQPEKYWGQSPLPKTKPGYR